MANYELSKAADRDFERIFEFGIERFGLEQAIEYQRGMIAQFEPLSQNPNLFQSVDHIRKGYRRSVYQSHSIYYVSSGDITLISRILGQENPVTELRKSTLTQPSFPQP